MFLVIGCLLMLFVGVFLVAGRVAPQSEFMNSFKKTNSFRNILISLTVIAGIFFVLHFFVVKNEDWRENAIIQVENEKGEIQLFQGVENEAAIAYDKIPEANKEYNTTLLVWGKYDDMIIHLKKKGDKDSVEQVKIKGELSRFALGAYFVPITLSFKEPGLWKITVENNDELIGDIVLEVGE